MSDLTTYPELEQGTDEWLEARRGIVTASVVGKMLTATGKVANNDTSRGIANLLSAERITGRVEPTFRSDAMWRGVIDEPIAREHYREHYAPVREFGFMVRDLGNGARLGWSPDGLVGGDGAIEVKSREPKIHLATILSNKVPAENVAQLQAGLLVSGRKWIDYLSWCGGMPMWRIRVMPDPAWFAAIEEAVRGFEMTAALDADAYAAAVEGLPATERIDHFQEARI